jgi:hypothetical protein
MKPKPRQTGPQLRPFFMPVVQAVVLDRPGGRADSPGRRAASARGLR